MCLDRRLPGFPHLYILADDFAADDEVALPVHHVRDHEDLHSEATVVRGDSSHATVMQTSSLIEAFQARVGAAAIRVEVVKLQTRTRWATNAALGGNDPRAIKSRYLKP